MFIQQIFTDALLIKKALTTAKNRKEFCLQRTYSLVTELVSFHKLMIQESYARCPDMKGDLSSEEENGMEEFQESSTWTSFFKSI